MPTLTSEQPVITNVEPLPPQVWLIIVGLALLSMAGIGWWVLLVAAAPATPLVDPTWLFLCR
jgi:hypothetical protein